MALDPTYDPYADDPYFAWARQQQLAQLQAPDPLALPSLDAVDGRKGGSTSGPGHDVIAQAVTAPPQELPAGALKTDEPEKPKQPEEPDAVSGAGEIPVSVTSVEPTTQQPPAPTSVDYVDWAKQHAAEQPLPSMQENDALASAKAEQQAVANMSPEDYIRWQGERAGKLRDMQAQRQSEIDAENQRRLQENYRLQQYAYQQAQAKTADLMAQAHALANTKVVTPKPTIANAVGIILGGMFSNGGPNMALAQFNRKVEQDIANQHANIENQWKGLDAAKTAIGEEYQRSGDLFHAQEVYRVAAYQQAIQQMQTELQKYDPAGATAAMIRTGLDQFHAAQASAIQDYNKQQIENGLKQAQTMQALAGARKTDQETYGLMLKQSGAGAGPAVKPEDIVTPDELAYIKQQTGIEFAPGVTRKEVNARIGTFKTVGEANKGATEAAGTLNAGLVRNPVTKQPLPNPTNPSKPLIYPVAQATELNDQIGATQVAIDNLSAARRMLQADPSTFDRKGWARIQTKIKQSFPALAKIYGEKYSARTEEALKDLLDLDFDGYISRVKDRGVGIAKIDETLDTLIENGNTTIGSKLGYDADKNPLFLDTSRPPESPKTPTDKAVQTLASQTSDKWTDEDHAIQKMRAAGAAKATAGQIYDDYGIDVRDPQFKADLERVKKTNVPISKLRALDGLKAQALGKDAGERSKAIAAMTEIAHGDGPEADEATKALGEVAQKLAPLINQAEDQVFGEGQ